MFLAEIVMIYDSESEQKLTLSKFKQGKYMFHIPIHMIGNTELNNVYNQVILITHY